MGSSVAIVQRDGPVNVLLPEDEMELAEATSDAELVSYKPATLETLRTPAEALVLPLTSLSRQLRFGDGQEEPPLRAELAPPGTYGRGVPRLR